MAIRRIHRVIGDRAASPVRARGRLAAAVAVVLAGMLAGCQSATTVRDDRSFVGRYAEHAVAADHPVASRAGAAMLERGGNAVDAAVATSFCLSVVRPFSCGIGGGGFMLIARPPDEVAAESGGTGRFIAINYRETAPAAVGPDYFEQFDDPDASRRGPHAVGVPGTVRGLLHALEHHGTLDRATVLQPAIDAAERGFEVDARFMEAMLALGAARLGDPRIRASTDYLWTMICRRGEARLGDVVTNPQQARALRLIAERGAPAFYEGPIADAILEAVEGGSLTAEDLAGARVDERVPLVGTFRGDTVVTMPPPSSGGVATLQVLGLLERILPDPLPAPDDPERMHLLAEALRHAFADRARWLADDRFVDVPIADLTSDAYLDELAARIDPYGTLADPAAYGSFPDPAEVSAALPTDGGTSHVSVVDGRGMAVACTETINLEYGAMVEVPDFGFALNDEMDDFTTRLGEPNAFGLVQSGRNLPEPGKCPLSSMTPTIVLREGEVIAVAGASGGPRIITGTLQALLSVLLDGEGAGDAVEAPRLHHQWLPARLDLEPLLHDRPSLRAALRSYGHEVGMRPRIGDVQIITVTDEGIEAASDPRKGGRPAGR